MDEDLPVVDPMTLPLPEESDEERYGVIKAPDSPRMAKAAEMFRALERRLEGSPAEFMLPGSGIAQVLERKAYGEDPSAFEYGMAGLDTLDLVPGAGTAVTTPLKAIFAGISAKGAKNIKARVDKLKERGLEGQDLWNAQANQSKRGYYDPLDNKFRVEIDTKEAKLSKNFPVTETVQFNPETEQIEKVPLFKLDRMKAVPLSEILDFPELFNQYPDLKTLSVKGNPFGGGSYDSASKIIRVGSDTDPKNVTSVLLHEIQHAVQDKEGFLAGGNYRMFMPPEFEEAKKSALNSKKSIEKDILERFEGLTPGAEEAPSSYEGASTLLRTFDLMFEHPEGSSAFFNEVKEAVEKGYTPKNVHESAGQAASGIRLYLGKNADGAEKFIRSSSDMLDQFREAGKTYDGFLAKEAEFEELYRKIPGEIEARNVQVSYEGFTPKPDVFGNVPEDVPTITPEDFKLIIPYRRGTPTEEAVFPLTQDYRNTLKKAQGGGVQSLAPIAKNMFRGYDDVKRGVGSYMPHTRYSRRR